MTLLWGFGRCARGGVAPVSLPRGARAYAMGDFHGQLDLLQQLLGRIDSDDAARGDATTHLILLGDRVDRGTDSAGFIRLVQRLAAASRHVRVIKGNHAEEIGRASCREQVCQYW